MTLADLLPALHELPRADKIRALQFISADLALDDQVGLAEGAQYPIWSPFNATDDAATLTQFLK